MTNKLAQDAMRYVSRTYADDAAHNRKMTNRHGDAWSQAVIIAGTTFRHHGSVQCMATLQTMIEDKLK